MIRFVLFIVFAVSLQSFVATTSVHAQSKVCVALEKQLKRTRSGARGTSSRIKSASKRYASADRSFKKAYRAAASRGCIAKKTLFGKKKKLPAACRKYSNNLSRWEKKRRAAYAQLKVAQREASRGVTPEKTLVRQLANAGCSGYKIVKRKVVKKNKGLMALLFGNNRTISESQIVVEKKKPRYNFRYRTVCVRTCDGYFFPVREVASKAHFKNDAEMCQSQCPEADSQLYIQRLSANDVFEEMRSILGEPYEKMENAFKFQKEYVKGCRCNTPRSNVAFLDPTKLKTDISRVGRVKELEISEDDIVEAPSSFGYVPLPQRRPLSTLNIADFDTIPRDRPGLLRTSLAYAVGGHPLPIPKPELNSQVSTLWIDLEKDYPDRFAPTEKEENIILVGAGEEGDIVPIPQMIIDTVDGGVAFSKEGTVAAYDGRPVRTVGQPLSLFQ